MSKSSDKSDLMSDESGIIPKEKNLKRREALGVISKTSTFVVAAGLLPTSWSPVTMNVSAQNATTLPPTTTATTPPPTTGTQAPHSAPTLNTIGVVTLAAGLGTALAVGEYKRKKGKDNLPDDEGSNDI